VKATVVDLRYKMPKVLKALRAREPVTLLYHGKVQGTIMPAKPAVRKRVEDSPFFGSRRGDKRSVKKIMDELRAPRYRAH
jgi:antitoxin (DNA-binding transcriptional repressor) of toxin-antitoxin stability system